jgi:hypothetical protein
MLRTLPLKVPELVDAAALDCRGGPHLTDGAAQAGIAVDDRQHRRLQAACDEVVEAAFPCGERLAAAQLQGEQMLMAIGKDTDDAEDWYAHHFSSTAHVQSEAIEVDVDHVEVGE